MCEVERPQFAVDETGRLVVDPTTRGGKPIVRGTRIGVSDILNYLAGGMTVEEIPGEFPGVAVADVQAALRYAGGLADLHRVTPSYRVAEPELTVLIEQMAFDERLDEAEIEGILRRRLAEGLSDRSASGSESDTQSPEAVRA